MKHLVLITALLSSIAFAQEPIEPQQIKPPPPNKINLHKSHFLKRKNANLMIKQSVEAVVLTMMVYAAVVADAPNVVMAV